jgi:hypothetical protein
MKVWVVEFDDEWPEDYSFESIHATEASAQAKADALNAKYFNIAWIGPGYSIREIEVLP